MFSFLGDMMGTCFWEIRVSQFNLRSGWHMLWILGRKTISGRAVMSNE